VGQIEITAEATITAGPLSERRCEFTDPISVFETGEYACYACQGRVSHTSKGGWCEHSASGFTCA
jgi:hypothetical protein